MRTWRNILAEATATLGDRDEARILIEEVAMAPMAELFSRLDDETTAADVTAVQALVARRRRGEPLQHVVGHWPFRGVDLVIDGRALVPRPETEIVVEVALRELDALGASAPRVVVDLGTGSGAIALAIAQERRDVKVRAVDNSEAALALAEENRVRNAIDDRVVLASGDFYAALDQALLGTVHCVVSNPPYLAEAEWETLPPVVSAFDPRGALIAGPIGFEAIAAVVAGAPRWLTRPGVLVVELAPHQAYSARIAALRAGARKVAIEPDLTGRERVLVAHW